MKQVVAVAGAREGREREAKVIAPLRDGRTDGAASGRAGGQIYGGERGGTDADAAPLNCGSNSFLKQQLVTRIEVSVCEE